MSVGPPKIMDSRSNLQSLVNTNTQTLRMEDHSDIQPSSHFKQTSILEELPGDLSDRFRGTMEDEINLFRQSME